MLGYILMGKNAGTSYNIFCGECNHSGSTPFTRSERDLNQCFQHGR